MRLNSDDKTVAAMDLLVPKVGELIGGSQREERLQVLLTLVPALCCDSVHVCARSVHVQAVQLCVPVGCK